MDTVMGPLTLYCPHQKTMVELTDAQVALQTRSHIASSPSFRCPSCGSVLFVGGHDGPRALKQNYVQEK